MQAHPLVIEDIFRPLEPYSRILLAVSGGADSMALMHLAARWLKRRGDAGANTAALPAIHVLTVDHGLRPEFAAEAEFVGSAAKRLGFGHSTLTWTGAKPASGLQAAAREARYGLMAAFARNHAYCCIVTAHHAGDQAETLLMRLARGSGTDGLAGMAPVMRLGGVDIVRPLLGLEKARLKAVLRAAGERWVDDPSNASDVFERVRLRRLLGMLRKEGIVPASLALSAKRLGRARQALHAAADALAQRAVTVDPSGYGSLDAAVLKDAPEEICIGVLSRAFQGFGGTARPPRLVQVEVLSAALRRGDMPRQVTLGGCLMRAKDATLYIGREPGRMGTPILDMLPGSTAIWDGRFTVTLDAEAPDPVQVAPPDTAYIRTHLPHLTGMARLAAETGPAFWRDGRLIAMPQLEGLPGEAGCHAVFLDPFAI